MEGPADPKPSVSFWKSSEFLRMCPDKDQIVLFCQFFRNVSVFVEHLSPFQCSAVFSSLECREGVGAGRVWAAKTLRGIPQTRMEGGRGGGAGEATDPVVFFSLE